ncbi:hypothetical protein pdam_00022024 [Pocillopora damicornis]|uniref:Chromo domain-containing protein n=1 Tax=Pocillopora damicornis TaxID=46731 RepID=A0A3M6UZF2_POCDA|nr:hypothetical protein pdam_00022024 [Pocillopora damicornis]
MAKIVPMMQLAPHAKSSILYGETIARVVERSNCTLTDRLYRYFTKSNNFQYLNILQTLVDGYNPSYHRSIGMKPSEVNTETSEQEQELQKLQVPDDALYPIEAILKRSGNKLLVKWVGRSDKFSSWALKKNVENVKRPEN